MKLQIQLSYNSFKMLPDPAIHRETTAQEILKDTDGKLIFFIAGVGTGGTLTGVGEVLKAHNPNIKNNCS